MVGALEPSDLSRKVFSASAQSFRHCVTALHELPEGGGSLFSSGESGGIAGGATVGGEGCGAVVQPITLSDSITHSSIRAPTFFIDSMVDLLLQVGAFPLDSSIRLGCLTGRLLVGGLRIRQLCADFSELRSTVEHLCAFDTCDAAGGNEQDHEEPLGHHVDQSQKSAHEVLQKLLQAVSTSNAMSRWAIRSARCSRFGPFQRRVSSPMSSATSPHFASSQKLPAVSMAW